MEDTRYGGFINNKGMVHGEVKYDRCHISSLGCFVNKQQIFKRTTLKQNCQVVKFSEKKICAAEYGCQYNVVRFTHIVINKNNNHMTVLKC